MSNQYLKCNNFFSRVATNTKKFDEYRTNELFTNLISGGKISFKQGTFTIKPNNRYVAVRFIINNTSSDVNLNLDINTENVNVGDILVLFIKRESESFNVTCNLSNNFYYLCGGGEESNFNLDEERICSKFIYDGDKYVNTYDNC